MTSRHFLVTGGTGFIGSALVRRLVRDGHRVRVLDDNSRGRPLRLADIQGNVELITGDVRDAAVVGRAMAGIDAVHHLAFVNGTASFYDRPDLVLEIAVKGMMNVLDACLANDVGTLFLASTSEVYQTPPRIPTDETVPLVVPDLMNPRYSYGGGKIISELLAINYGRTRFEKVSIYRPHNVYGPDMGAEHVLPQFVLRLKALCEQSAGYEQKGSDASGSPVLRFPIQGSGRETRSFCHIDDFIDGVTIVQECGEHLGLYHVGTRQEVAMQDLARKIARCAGYQIEIVPGALAPGSTPRRCPDIAKLAAIGYAPKVSLDDGISQLLDWYWPGARRLPAALHRAGETDAFSREGSK